ncbi:response regulator transcription factor [Rhodovulum sp. YEN HP10]|uniref:response regulator transcription factor n=1 Tax=Rhodovulum sp. HP10 TaxID=3387397 RepID=UPI0039E14F64
MRVLVIEDGADLAEAIRTYLSRDGHAVDLAADCAEAGLLLDLAQYDGIVLDLGLPDGSGLDLLRVRRRDGLRTPVVILSARDRIGDRIAGLDCGADDYVVKPVDLGELAARLRANARRGEGAPGVELAFGPLRIDRARARVWRDGAEIRLTAREWAVLDALLAARGRVLSRQVLEDRLYDFDAGISGNAVEVYVSRLRGKLGRGLIETRRGIGYQIP